MATTRTHRRWLSGKPYEGFPWSYVLSIAMVCFFFTFVPQAIIPCGVVTLGLAVLVTASVSLRHSPLTLVLLLSAGLLGALAGAFIGGVFDEAHFEQGLHVVALALAGGGITIGARWMLRRVTR